MLRRSLRQSDRSTGGRAVFCALLTLALAVCVGAGPVFAQGGLGPRPPKPEPKPAPKPEPKPPPKPRPPAKPTLGQVFGDDLGDGTRIELVYITPGSFAMGSPTGDDDDRTVHGVTLTRPFLMGRYEVTQAQWMAVMGSNPSYFTGDPTMPVESVTFNDIQAFLSKLNGQTDGGWRLPTEAEWEYACRAGTMGEYAGELVPMAWFDANSDETTHPVGGKKPNAWGLYDMHGNVWEFCSDWFGPYSAEAQTDPTGPESGTERVYRGGSWNFFSRLCRSSFRDGYAQDVKFNDLGFRLVKDVR